MKKPTPPPQFKLRLDPALKAEIEREAEKHGVSINAEVNNRLQVSFVVQQSVDDLRASLQAQSQAVDALRGFARTLAFYLKELSERMTPPDDDVLTLKLLEHVRNLVAHLQEEEARNSVLPDKTMAGIADQLRDFYAERKT